MNQTKTKFSLLFILCLLGGLIYANALPGPFQFDDYPVIVNNPVIQSDSISTLWQNVHHPTRFIAYLSFAFNYQLDGLNPVGFHLFNIIIHLANACFVFWLVLMIGKTPYMRAHLRRLDPVIIGAVSAFLFLVHPVQTESVTYITQRFTSLATFFYLLSLCLYLKGRINQAAAKRGWTFFIGSAILALSGMFTKQITITLPLVIALTELSWMREGQSRRRLWLWTVLIAFLLIIPSLYHFNVGNILSITHESGSHRGDVITSRTYLMTQPRVIMTYLKLLVFPVNQNLLYDFKITPHWLELKNFLSCLLILFLAGLGTLSYRRNRLIAFGIAWFFITLSVESTVIPIRHLIFEHRLYLPSVGIFISATVILYQWLKDKYLFASIVSVLICLLSIMTVSRNEVWLSGIQMWRDVVAKSPQHERAHYNLGYEYMKVGQEDAALAHLSEAIKLRPKFYDAYHNRSQIYVDQGQLKSALLDINQAIGIDDTRAEAFLNRGVILRKLGQYELALKDFDYAIRLDDSKPYYYTNRGLTRGNIGQYAEAITDLDLALAIDPNYAKAFNIRGALHLAQKDKKKALNDFYLAITHDPRLTQAYSNRAQLLQSQLKFDLALLDLNKLIELAPNDMDAYSRRAFVYTKLERLDEALGDFTHILSQDPDAAKIYMEKGKIYYRKHDYGQAAQAFSTALTKSPENALGYLLRGLCRYELKEYDDALSDMSKAKELGHPVDTTYFQRINQALNKQ